MQAAILRARLPRLRGWTERRRALAARYRRAAGRRAGRACCRERDPGHVYHLFVVRSGRSATRCRRIWRAHGIETLIHYPVPIPRQPALAAEQPARLSGCDARCATRYSRCRFTRRLRDDDVDEIAARCTRSQPRTVIS